MVRALSSRLTLIVGLIVLFVTVAVSLSGYFSGRATIERQIQDRVEASSTTTMASVDAYLAARAEELRQMANAKLTQVSLSAQDRTRIIFDYAQAFGNNRYSDISIVDPSGKLVASTGGPDFTTQKALIEKFNAATKPGIADLLTYADVSTPEYTVYAPLVDETGKHTGTLVGRLQTTELVDLVRTVPVDDHGSLFLLHAGQPLAIHRGDHAPTLEQMPGAMHSTVTQKAGMTDLGLSVSAAFDRGAALAPVTQLAVRSVIVGLIVLGLSWLAITLVARRIAKPLHAVAGAAQRLAAGEISARVDLNRGDVQETVELADAFNTMSETLRALLGGIDHASRTVSGAVRENVMVADSVRTGTEEQAAALGRITAALSEVAANARSVRADCASLEGSSRGALGRIDQLLREVDTTTVALHQLRATIDRSNEAGTQLARQSVAVAERAREVGRRAEAAKEAADAGDEAVRLLVHDVRNVGDRLVDTVERLDHLADSTAGAIRAQVDVINDIAERSKLLALNAGIEAARAGEHGRGFGVIAQELHRLASGSKDASDEVKALVHAVVAETTQLVTSATTASELAKGAVDRAAQTGTTIERLVSEIRDNAANAAEIGAIAADQAERTSELETATDEMRTMAETTARSAQLVGDLSRDVRGAIDLATQVASQVASATSEQTQAFDVMERSAVEIQTTTQRVADAAARSFAATDSLQREVQTLIETVGAFGDGSGGSNGGNDDAASAALAAAAEIATGSALARYDPRVLLAN